MAGNLLPVSLNSTFQQKVKNFPDSVYNFDPNDNLTTLMKILLGNSGTSQLRNLQIAARLGQERVEFSNLDTILGMILDIQRNSSEIYSFSTNPFIDQLNMDQWEEVIKKDSDYRNRLLGAAEAFQTGATIWSVITLCEAMTNMRFYVTETWRTPGFGRSGINSNNEIVIIPILDDTSNFTWNQGKARLILDNISKIIQCNFTISFGTPIINLFSVGLQYVDTENEYQEYFSLVPIVNGTQINSPEIIFPGSETRRWLKNNGFNEAPYFAHLHTQELVLDMTGNIIDVSSTSNTDQSAKSLSKPTLQVTSTIYGAQ